MFPQLSVKDFVVFFFYQNFARNNINNKFIPIPGFFSKKY